MVPTIIIIQITNRPKKDWLEDQFEMVYNLKIGPELTKVKPEVLEPSSPVEISKDSIQAKIK